MSLPIESVSLYDDIRSCKQWKRATLAGAGDSEAGLLQTNSNMMEHSDRNIWSEPLFP